MFKNLLIVSLVIVVAVLGWFLSKKPTELVTTRTETVEVVRVERIEVPVEVVREVEVIREVPVEVVRVVETVRIVKVRPKARRRVHRPACTC